MRMFNGRNADERPSQPVMFAAARRRLSWLSPARCAAKPFQAMPSPRQLPLIGHTHLFLPVVGAFRADRLTEAVAELAAQLGPVFRLRLGGADMVVSTEPDDARTLFRHEGRQPRRPDLPALRRCRAAAFRSAGVVASDGDEWQRLRSAISTLMKPAALRAYEARLADVCDAFVRHVCAERDAHGVLRDLYGSTLRFATEAISVLALGRRLPCLVDVDEDAERVLRAGTDFMEGLHETVMGPPLWKLFRTAGYRKLESAHRTVGELVERHLSGEAAGRLRAEQPFLGALLDNPRLTAAERSLLAAEMFLGGMDATATTLALALHQLSHDERAQELARRDASGRYLHACLRETLRLWPTAGATSRVLAAPADIGGFLVPRGTLVSAFSSVTSAAGAHFPRPGRFEPERWARGAAAGGAPHPFASLPFGHGPRMCPGRQFALLEMKLLLARVLRRFRLQAAGPAGPAPVGMLYRMNRVPERRLDAAFLDPPRV